MNRRKFITTVGTFALGIPTAVLAAEVTLQWNPVAEADGYKIYWGTDSRFLDSVSGPLRVGPLYECNATIVAGTTARLNGQIVTVGQDTVVSSPLDVLDTNTSMIVITDPDTYYFAVTAYNNYGESEYSEEVHTPITNTPGDVHNIRTVKFKVPPAPMCRNFTDFTLILPC